MVSPRRRSTDRQPRPWRLVVIMALSCVLIGSAVFTTGFVLAARTMESCDGIHRLYLGIDRIMADNDRRIAEAVAAGRITPAQAAESRTFNRRARATLRSADCAS